MAEQSAVVAVYHTHQEAELGIKKLEKAGVNMRSLSILGKGTHTDEHVLGFYNTGDRIKYWGKTGAVWGGFWGLLFGSAFFSIPTLGTVLAAGPIIGWIVGALEGAVLVGGVSAIGAGLVGMGIEKNSVIQYELALKTDKYLLLVQGTPEEIEKARTILDSTRPFSAVVHACEPSVVNR